MAKKNKGKRMPNKGKVSTDKYIIENARKLPIDKCYITSKWQENGMATVVVTRKRNNGNFIVCSFLVDTYCLGVKDCLIAPDMLQSDVKDLISRYKSRQDMEEVSYEVAHNVIYGALGFAEDAGLTPTKDFKIAQYILEEDTEDIPLIEYEFGKDGKYFLITYSNSKDRLLIPELKKNLGDEFKYVIDDVLDDYDDPEDEVDYNEDDNAADDLLPPLNYKQLEENLHKAAELIKEEKEKYPDEEYSYAYPSYPSRLEHLNYSWLADELFSPENYDNLPKDVIDRILALPADKVAEDLSRCIYFEIGRTYKAINNETAEDPTESSIIHALNILANIDSEKGFESIMELLRQNDKFSDYHLGDLASYTISTAIYKSGRNRIKELEHFLSEPCFSSFMKDNVVEALVTMMLQEPVRRDEILSIFRRQLESMLDRLPRREGCDGNLAGFLMAHLADIRAVELLPEIKKVYSTGYVNPMIAGDYEEVVEAINSPASSLDTDKYALSDIYKEYGYQHP